MLALPLFSELIQHIDVQHVRLVCNGRRGAWVQKLDRRALADTAQTHPNGGELTRFHGALNIGRP